MDSKYSIDDIEAVLTHGKVPETSAVKLYFAMLIAGYVCSASLVACTIVLAVVCGIGTVAIVGMASAFFVCVAIGTIALVSWVHAKQIRDSISLWLDDAVVAAGGFVTAEYRDDSLGLPTSLMRVSFEMDGVSRVVTGKKSVWGTPRGCGIYAGATVKILYSPRYDEVMILRGELQKVKAARRAMDEEYERKQSGMLANTQVKATVYTCNRCFFAVPIMFFLCGAGAFTASAFTGGSTRLLLLCAGIASLAVFLVSLAVLTFIYMQRLRVSGEQVILKDVVGILRQYEISDIEKVVYRSRNRSPLLIIVDGKCPNGNLDDRGNRKNSFIKLNFSKSNLKKIRTFWKGEIENLPEKYL